MSSPTPWKAAAFAFLLATAVLLGARAADGAALVSKTSDFSIPWQKGRAITPSPDGMSVYVAVHTETVDRLVVFHRDLAGGLDELQAFEDGSGGITAMDDPEFITVSPDGETVVVASTTDASLIVFDRDPATGLLTFVHQLVDGVGGVDGLAGVTEAAFSPDSAHLYSAARFEAAGVGVFDHDSITSALTPIEQESTWAGPRSLAVSPDGLHVYTDRGSFSRDAVTGELTFLETHLGSSGPVRIHPTGLWLYYMNSAGFSRYDRDPATGLVVSSGGQYWSHPDEVHWSSAIHPSGEHIFFAYEWVPNQQTPWITSYDFGRGDIDPATGSITGWQNISWSPRTGGPGLLSVAADGSSLFVARDDHTHAYDYTIEPDGTLTERAIGFSGAFHPGALEEVIRSADDKHLYLGAGGGVSVWSRDLVSGALTYVDGEISVAGQFPGLDSPHGLALSPDGAHLYAAASENHSVAWFDRSAGTGEIDPVGLVEDGVGGVDGIGGAYDVVVSPDGAHVYACGHSDNAVAVFSRDGVSGALTFIEAHFDGQAGVHGMDGANEIAFSPDGLHVYVAAEDDDAVAVFGRNPATGALTFVEAKVEGIDGVQGLVAPGDLELSADGNTVYAFATNPPAVVEFTRDAATGGLTFRDAHIDALGGAYGIEGHFALSGDGLHAYAGRAVFKRNPATGALSFIEVLEDRLAITNLDGTHVYSLWWWGAMALWEHEFSGCDPQPLAGCKLALKTTLALKDAEDPAKQKLTWAYVNGEPTTIGSFDPGTNKHYGFCLYDESGGSPALVFEALLPAHGDCRKNYAGLEKPCWSKTSKVKYADPFLTPDGIKTALLQPSQIPKTRIKLKGKGSQLPLDGLPFGLPLRAQLQNAFGDCWEATYTTAKRNDGKTFKAKSQ